MKAACGVEGDAPGSGLRIVQFRACENAAKTNASDDKHLAVEQQRCRVRHASDVEAASRRLVLTLPRFQGRVAHNETLTVSICVSDPERSGSFAGWTQSLGHNPNSNRLS